MTGKPSSEDIVGGQAVIEGVMMRRGNKFATAVRKPDREIIIQERYHVPFAKRNKVFGLFLIRGFVTLVEMMIIGVKTIMFSAEPALEREEKKPAAWEMALMILTSFGLALIFFIVIPAYAFTLLKGFISGTFVLNLIEDASASGYSCVFYARRH